MRNALCNLYAIDFLTSTRDETLALVYDTVRRSEKKVFHTVNVDHLVIASRNPLFEQALTESDYKVADGFPIVLTSKWKKGVPPIAERVTGADLTVEILRRSREKQTSVYILGCQPGVVETALRKVRELWGEALIAGYHSPSPSELESPERNRIIVDNINRAQPHILLVALGAPKQELWIFKHKNELNVNVMMGVGGAIDYIAGVQKRAPLLLQKANLEWFYRLIMDPKRMFRRYVINDSKFLLMFLKEISRPEG
ncbi:WecB/TagA/CpsF family glycosyltransferase [Cohnella sp. CFH 77786]|uniref:WecB/TagA/CpsF family glycosyltransferase n=1 Tax=Cohnella sp. CFH 77786 TaxID=2662265 RepID=UPI001C60DAE8|nr:WecB/TagA/CpsF family glycosyltransferase [Cohnella sp. CFH 77786]MBW5447126.1 WecB/TagA/CpsF family glycosyltransferase [Cohnella sp. CFH 77786]